MVAALSPSRASDFMQCPLLYRFRVIDRLPSAPSAAAARGTLVHSVLERLFDLPADARTMAAAAALVEPQWRALLEDEPELGQLVDDSDVAALDSWFADAVSLIERWFALEDPTRLEPAERELYVETDLDGLTLRGYVDRLDLTPTGEMRVVDYKTGRSPSELFEAKALFQMKFYALVLWRLRGQVPRMLQLVYLGNSEIVRFSPEEDDLLAVERKVKALWKAIETAARTGDWRPSKSRLCDWCDHQALCPAWGGTPPPLPEGAEVLALDPRASAAVVPDEDLATAPHGTSWHLTAPSNAPHLFASEGPPPDWASGRTGPEGPPG
jgi:putative RecB family exonuclease